MRGLTFTLLLFFSTSLVAQNTLNDSLQLWYPFSGNAGDSSGNGVHGILNSQPTPTTDRFGNASSAYHFDGQDDWIDTDHSYDFEYRTGSVWAVLEDTTEIRLMYTQDDNQLNYGTFNSFFHNSTPKWRAFAGGAGPSARGEMLNHVPFESWIHTAAVRDGSTNYYYVNGKLKDTKPSNTSGSVTGGNPNLLIGVSRTESSRFWLGKLDDLRVYNRALKAWEVYNLYCPADAVIRIDSVSPNQLQVSNDSTFAALGYDWYINGSLVSTDPIHTFPCNDIDDQEIVLVNSDGFCTARDTVTISQCNPATPEGFVERKSEATLIVYPNPFENEVHVRYLSDEATMPYQVFNTVGQMVQTGILQRGNNNVDISNLPNGVYIFQSHATSVRILKKK